MATLSVLRFSSVGGASAALEDLRALHAAGRLDPRDVAVLSWEAGERLPDLRPVPSLRPRTPMGAGFWNLLSSHLFQLPLVAASVGLSADSTSCSLADLGIRDGFLRTVQDRVTSGSSALFLLTDDATVDRLIHLLEHLAFTVVSTSLSTRQLEAWQFGFGAGPPADGERDDPLSGPPVQGPGPLCAEGE